MSRRRQQTYWDDPTARRATRPTVNDLRRLLEQKLDERDARLLTHKYAITTGVLLTRRELATLEGVSEQRIDQLTRRADERLREQFDPADADELLTLLSEARLARSDHLEDGSRCEECGKPIPLDPNERRGRPRKLCHNLECRNVRRRRQYAERNKA